MTNEPGCSWLCGLCGLLPFRCCKRKTLQEDWDFAPDGAHVWFASLPNNCFNNVIPAESQLAALRTCKFLRNEVLRYHNGMVVSAAPLNSGNACEFMGDQHKACLDKGLKTVEFALQHDRGQNMTLLVSGKGFNSPYPELSEEFKMLMQSFQLTELRRLRITGFRVSDLIPLSFISIFPNLTHLQLDDMAISKPYASNSNNTGDGKAVLPDLTASKLQHLSIGTYRVFMKKEERAAWLNRTTKHTLPNVSSLTAVSLHYSFTRFVDPANVRRLKLSGEAGQRSIDIPGNNNPTAALLEPYSKLTHLSITAPLSSHALPAVLGMRYLQEVEFDISNCYLQKDFSQYSWPLQRLTLSMDNIKPATFITMQHLPLQKEGVVHVKRFQAVQLPDSLAVEFTALANKFQWARQTHEVDVSIGTAAAAALVPCLDKINISDECMLDEQFLLALARTSQSRRLTVRMLWVTPNQQQLQLLPVLCQHNHSRYVLGVKPIILQHPLPRLHNLTAPHIVAEVLDILLRLTNTTSAADARLELKNRFLRWDDDKAIANSVLRLQGVFCNWFKHHAPLQDVVEVFNNEFGVVSLYAGQDAPCEV